VDGVIGNGCECADGETVGNTCAAAVNLGDLPDGVGGKTISVTGRIVSNGDEDWYKVHALDTPDAGSFSAPAYDKFNLRATLNAAAEAGLKLLVRKGDCAVADPDQCTGARAAGWSTATATTPDASNPWGKHESPCVTKDASTYACQAGSDCCEGSATCTQANKKANWCTSQDNVYYVKVYRSPAAAPTSCDQYAYTLTIVHEP